MKNMLQITEYYELVALHKALWSARFAREPLLEYLPGSPFLADIANRVVDVLAKMEIERGRPERANDWRMEVSTTGEIWQIMLRNASEHPDFWKKQSTEEKKKIARIYLSPFVITDEILDEFIRQVDEKCNASPREDA